MENYGPIAVELKIKTRHRFFAGAKNNNDTITDKPMLFKE